MIKKTYCSNIILKLLAIWSWHKTKNKNILATCRSWCFKLKEHVIFESIQPGIKKQCEPGNNCLYISPKFNDSSKDFSNNRNSNRGNNCDQSIESVMLTICIEKKTHTQHTKELIFHKAETYKTTFFIQLN